MTRYCPSSGVSLSADAMRERPSPTQARCPSCKRLITIVGRPLGRFVRHAVPTFTVRLTREELEAVVTSLNEHMAGDPDDLFDVDGIADDMRDALDKVEAVRLGAQP